MQNDKDWKDLVSEWQETSRSQVCPECGASPIIESPEWRWDGEFWQHYHGYPTGHIRCILKENYHGKDDLQTQSERD